jgi:hypothetical protein
MPGLEAVVGGGGAGTDDIIDRRNALVSPKQVLDL